MFDGAPKKLALQCVCLQRGGGAPATPPFSKVRPEIVMLKRAKKRAAPKIQPETLKGWQQIAAFLGEPSSVVQRWASEGMPVRRQGRFVSTTPEELNAWLGKESGKPVHVATENTDLTAELKRGLSLERREKDPSPRCESYAVF